MRLFFTEKALEIVKPAPIVTESKIIMIVFVLSTISDRTEKGNLQEMKAFILNLFEKVFLSDSNEISGS
jgi:hypothetical protein